MKTANKCASIGLIAGNGRFPFLFAAAAKKRGLRVVAVAMEGETDIDLATVVDDIAWVRVGQLRKMIGIFRRAGINRAAMAGGVRKTRLYENARPDWLGLWVLARCALRRDDGMLRQVAAAFERGGVSIVESTLYMPDALAPVGVLSSRQPTPEQWRDLQYGLSVAQEIGRLDIGQTVVVKSGAVVALEAIEGTDACIQRAGRLLCGRGGVMVKVAKPTQDMRFDVPTIGTKTVTALARAGIQVLGIEANRTLVLEPQRFLDRANEKHLVVVGLTSGSKS